MANVTGPAPLPRDLESGVQHASRATSPSEVTPEVAPSTSEVTPSTPSHAATPSPPELESGRAAGADAAAGAAPTEGTTKRPEGIGPTDDAEHTHDVPERPHASIWMPTSEIFAALPPTHWLVPGLYICAGRPMLVAGYGYSGKTLIWQAALLALAAGEPLWGMFEVARPMRVGFLDFEQGSHGSCKRFQRLAAGEGYAPDDLGDRLWLRSFPPFKLNSKNAASEIARAVDGLDFCLIDTFRAAVPGAEENDSRIRQHIDPLTEISLAIGCAFGMLTHQGKARSDDDRGNMRGSSAIFDAAGNVLNVTSQKDDPARTVSQTKAPAEAEGKAVPDFDLEIVDLDPLPNGVRPLRVRAVDQDAVADQVDKRAVKIAEAVRAQPGLNRGALAKVIGGRRTTMLGAIDDAISEGRIEQREGGLYVA